MVKVMKSPNMMSTTGRIPVIAAPTASPVNPASEIGVSSTRSLPNSSSRPERTLNGVPASATSSPIMQTVSSRRISSARASRMACANVNSRSVASGIHVLVHFVDGRIRRGDRELYCLFHLGFKFSLHPCEPRCVGELLFDQPLAEIRDRIALGFPGLLFLLGAVIFAVDVAHMMSVIAIGIAEQKCGTLAAAGAIHQPLRGAMNRAHVLAIDTGSLEAEGSRSCQDISGGR